MPNHYKISPQGLAKHAWVNKPDTKFNAEGLYHTGLILEGEIAQSFKDEIKAESDRAHAEEMANLNKDGSAKFTKAEQKKFTVYYPFEDEMDDDGETPTGRVIFNFKQNAKIRQPDGGMKAFKLGIRDADDKATTASVFGGSTIRVKYKCRNILMTSLKQAGVRLDFSMVQLIAQAAHSSGFGKVDGGYVDDGGSESTGTKDAGADEADY